MSGSPLIFLLLISSILLSTGCGKKTEEPAQRPEVSQTAQVNPETAGSITGRITFEGEVPPAKELPVQGNPECSVIAHGKILSEELIVKDGNLANVFVYVKEGLPDISFAPPAEPVEVANFKCAYVPHVTGAQVHQPVRFINKDATLHNFHAYPKNQPGWNMGLPFEGMKQTKKFGTPEVMIPLKCDVHPWMIGYIGVLPHPYFAVTGEDGTFEIKNLPPGSYVIEVWHETLGTQTVSVTVGVKETKEVGFKFGGQ